MKLTKHAWILWGISLVVFLILAFLIPFAHTGTFWFAFGATLIMFGVTVFVFARAFRKDETPESKLLGWPIFKVGYVALIVQIIVGFALMGIAFLCPVWAAVIAEVIVFAVTGFCLTVKDAARDAVTAAEVKVTDNTAAWKAIRARANAIAAETGHPDIKKLAEEIRYADPTPTGMDGEIAQMLETLSSYADAANIRKALAMMEQRKALAKDSKLKK
ncbi:MAG: hypothetical protein MJ142_06085 [Clostridia bacterium]|nr:hypothetical protein [Clostridia bacterium]